MNSALNILRLAFFFFALNASAATVSFTFTNSVGNPDTNVFRVLSISDPILADGGWVQTGIAIRMTPDASGVCSTNLLAGNYLATNSVLRKGIAFAVPSGSGSYNMGDLAISAANAGYNLFNYSPPAGSGTTLQIDSNLVLVVSGTTNTLSAIVSRAEVTNKVYQGTNSIFLAATNSAYTNSTAYTLATSNSLFNVATIAASNYTAQISTNGTNWGLTLATTLTNYVRIFGTNGTNFTLTLGTNATNHVTASTNTAFLSATNQAYIFSTNAVNAGTNTSWQSGTNFAGTNGAARLLTATNTLFAALTNTAKAYADATFIGSSYGLGTNTALTTASNTGNFYISGNLGFGKTGASRYIEILTALGSENKGIALFNSAGTIKSTFALDNDSDLTMASADDFRIYTGSTIGDVITKPTNQRFAILSSGEVDIFNSLYVSNQIWTPYLTVTGNITNAAFQAAVANTNWLANNNGRATNATINGQTNIDLTASKLVLTDANKKLVSSSFTDTGITNAAWLAASNYTWSASNSVFTAGTNAAYVATTNLVKLGTNSVYGNATNAAFTGSTNFTFTNTAAQILAATNSNFLNGTNAAYIATTNLIKLATNTLAGNVTNIAFTGITNFVFTNTAGQILAATNLNFLAGTNAAYVAATNLIKLATNSIYGDATNSAFVNNTNFYFTNVAARILTATNTVQPATTNLAYIAATNLIKLATNTLYGVVTNLSYQVSTGASFVLRTDGYGTNTILTGPTFTNAVNRGNAFSSPGSGTSAEQFGNGALATNNNALAVGSGALAYGHASVAVGDTAVASGRQAVAIGTDSIADKTNSVAIGTSALAIYAGSVAIGVDSASTAENQIRLGTASQSVSIPGPVVLDTNLSVAGNFSVTGRITNSTVVGSSSGAATNLTVKTSLALTNGSGNADFYLQPSNSSAIINWQKNGTTYWRDMLSASTTNREIRNDRLLTTPFKIDTLTDAITMSGNLTVSGNITNAGLNALVNLSNTVFVSKSGSDSTGSRGLADKPFLTPNAAKTAASAGDVVFVAAGTYSVTNLWKPGVHWFFAPGAIIEGDQFAGPIFNDTIGAGTNIVAGSGIFRAFSGVFRSTNSGTKFTMTALVLSNYNTDPTEQFPVLYQTAGTNSIVAKSIYGVTADNNGPIFINGGELRLVSDSIENPNEACVQAESGTLFLDAKTITGYFGLEITTATVYARGQKIIGVGAYAVFLSGAGTAVLQFDDYTATLSDAINQSAGTLSVFGGLISSSNNGSDGVDVSGGTANIFSAKVTTTATGKDFRQTGGTLNIDGCSLDTTKLSGTITRLDNFFPLGLSLPAKTIPPVIGVTNGAHVWTDGTNLCVILMDAAGVKTTNKLSMASWP